MLLTFNRPDHTLRVLNSLRGNAAERVFVYLDKSENPEDQVQQEKLMQSFRQFGHSGMDIVLQVREKPFGLARNLTGAVSERFRDGAEGVIVLEDDCVVRPGGLAFFESGLHQLSAKKSIRSLCGFLPNSPSIVRDGEDAVVLAHRFVTWGWATWSDRWDQYNPDLRSVVKGADVLNVRIEDFARDLAVYCASERYLAGLDSIWSLNWILLHFLTSSFAVYPPESVIDNIGFDGSGTNSKMTNAFEAGPEISLPRSLDWNSLRYFPENDYTLEKFMSSFSHDIYPDPSK